MKPTTFTRTNSDNPDFRQLILQLDKYLAIRNGDANDFFAQYNKVDLIKHVVVAYQDNMPVGCGGIKQYSDGVMEVKRMFVLPEHRGQGIGRGILKELENWSAGLDCEACVLETGKDMVDAVRLYQKSGYGIIPNYGQYETVESSVCMQKKLTAPEMLSNPITVKLQNDFGNIEAD